MPSTWGRRNGLKGYDKFRTGLTFAQARIMLHVHNNDPSTWRYKRRNTVLGLMHELKMQMYQQMLDREETIPF